MAFAETLAAPVGGRAISLGPDRVACREGSATMLWTIEPDGHGVRPPTRDDAVGQVTAIHVAPTEADCKATTATVGLLAIGAKPVADLTSVILDVDAGRVVIRGQRLRGAVLEWNVAGRRGDDICSTPEIAPGAESCAFAVPQDLPADPTLPLIVLPAGLRSSAEVVLFDASGRRTGVEEYAVRPSQVFVSRLFAPDTSAEISSGTAHVALLHPEAVATVDCTDATCDVAGRELVVRGEHGPDARLDVHLQLRPRVALRTGTTADAAPVLTIPLQRCPVALASAPPIFGAAETRLVLRIGSACARAGGDLEYTTPLGSAQAESSLAVGGDQYVVIRAGRLDSDTIVSVRRRGTVVGSVQVTPRRAPAIRARLDLPELGSIDFIPTNRWARLSLPPLSPPGRLIPIAIEGAYEVRNDRESYWIRGSEGAAGATLLRFAYVDPSLPGSLKGTRLGDVSEPVDRSLRVANVPVPIGALARTSAPLVEVVCGDGDGHVRGMLPETTSFIPYRARDTCQVAIHREQLREEDGAQAFQISVQVTTSDGVARGEAHLERKLVLRHAERPTYLAIAGAMAPFDRILVRAGLADDETHYAVAAPEKGAAQVQWSIVTGTDHIRLYGTAAIPTGLFRVADSGHSGILTLSVGALIRAVVLSKEGTEFPVGLEAGVMWLGIAGDTDPAASSRGAVALVVGPGISVPIANVSRVSQTSIGLHGWFEYEVSRTILSQSGRAIGFVFGPSISIGDIGTNF
ncbi:MAG: hypothetical protein ABIP39_04245 [Polyangiaceae bacterium]